MATKAVLFQFWKAIIRKANHQLGYGIDFSIEYGCFITKSFKTGQQERENSALVTAGTNLGDLAGILWHSFQKSTVQQISNKP